MEKEKLISVVSAAQQGDSEALNELFNTFYNDVYYFALKTLKDEDLACDITQDTFVKIINSIATLSEPAAFVTWMKQIAYHLCLNHFRKKKDILVDEDEEGNTIFDILAEDRAEFIPGEALDQQDFRNTILAMLDRLSPEQRAATMLFYYDEFSVKQIAQIQGVSEGTVKSRLNYARKAIKSSVEDYEKKHNVKLHSFGLFPFMAWLFSGAGSAMPAASAAAIAASVSTITGTSIAVAGSVTSAVAASAALSGSVAVATVSTTTGTGILSALTTLPLAVKIAIATVAGVAVIGGVGAAVRPEAPPAPTTPTQTATEDVTTPTPTEPPFSEPDPTETTLAETTQPTQTVTEPPATEPPQTTPTEAEPTVTEPVVTEPEATEPEATEPEATEPPADVRYVPAGCTYVLADGTTVPAGDPMPASVSYGDKFLTADYTYVYTADWLTSYTAGWGVTVNDTTKSSYEPLRSEINGQPLVGLGFTFMGCSNMTVAPTIPSTVRTLDRAFYGCKTLTQPPAIPSGVWNMSEAFAFCTSLQTAPTIPGGVTNLWKAFNGCESMTSAPAIPGGVTDLYETFKYCTSLRSAPSIPAGVTNMTGTFAQCWSLTTAPVIPAAVSVMESTFSGCSSLSGTVTIHATPSYYQACFSGVPNPITLNGSGTNLAELAATGASVSVAAE
ncbi:MAG: sigma-70 family RNA polymerase sigma factor [Oscillospiraceae bacterium]|nr:sigma-70 family RNA polymerase sigma factor [Oscillospiraceae bacterium]